MATLLNPSLRIQYFRDRWIEGVLPGYIPTITDACHRYWHAKYLQFEEPHCHTKKEDNPLATHSASSISRIFCRIHGSWLAKTNIGWT